MALVQVILTQIAFEARKYQLHFLHKTSRRSMEKDNIGPKNK
jgi:hypothetical protein